MSNLTTQFNLRTDNNGIPGTIINSPINIGDTFFVEVLMGDIRNDAVGIISSNISLFFNPNQLQNIDNPFATNSLSSPLLPANFPLLRTGILNNNNGTITNLGGGAFPSIFVGSPIGINQLQTFSLMHFKAINSGDSSLSLNIDLSQTGFADGTFVSLTTPNQFTKPISINSQTVPEPLTILGVITASVFGILFKRQLLKNS